MALFQAVGSHLIPQEDMPLLALNDNLQRLLNPADSLEKLSLRSAVLEGPSLRSFTPALPGGATPREPVALGRPLSIELDYIYTGEYPRSAFRFGNPDMLVTSAVRAPQQKPQPKALNMLRRGVQRHQSYSNSASGEGTSLIYYTPALTDDVLFLDVDLAIENVDEEAFQQAGDLLGQAAALPILVAQSGYLLVASQIVKLVGKLAEYFMDRESWLAANQRLMVSRPGASNVYGPLVMCRNEHNAELGRLQVSPDGKLIDPRTNAEYAGKAPYATLYLDGRERPNFKDFQPAVAAVDVLDRFYRIRERDASPASIILDALKLYNDADARKQVESLNAQIAAVPAGSEAQKALILLRDAWLKKIQNEIFKPKTAA